MYLPTRAVQWLRLLWFALPSNPSAHGYKAGTARWFVHSYIRHNETERAGSCLLSRRNCLAEREITFACISTFASRSRCIYIHPRLPSASWPCSDRNSAENRDGKWRRTRLWTTTARSAVIGTRSCKAGIVQAESGYGTELIGVHSIGSLSQAALPVWPPSSQNTSSSMVADIMAVGVRDSMSSDVVVTDVPASQTMPANTISPTMSWN